MRRGIVVGLGLVVATVLALPSGGVLAAPDRREHPALSGPAAKPLPPTRPRDESNRPASCPGSPGADPNVGDSEPQTSTGTFPWPPIPRGVPLTAVRRWDHTPHTRVPRRPANWSQGGGDWKLTSARANDRSVAQNPQELCGVKGNRVDKAWQTTTGRPSTVIAVTDSGIEWCDAGVVDKIYLNAAALPLPENAAGLTKVQLAAGGRHFADPNPYDLNDDGVLNVADYSADPRLARPLFCGSFVSPEDLIRAFGRPSSPHYYGHQGPAGFTEAIAGWNFLDNTNDPYDDVHYDHGTGEAEDSTGAADALNNEVGSCPNCMVLPIRVGESFIAQSDAFAQGVLFAVDSGASVIQEALGTYDLTATTRQAINYANGHGVPVVASAADEEAEHHNLPGYAPGTIVVNSVTQTPSEGGVPIYEPNSYLHVNGCTNYGGNIAVSVESGSCSSEATGKTGGIVGLAESAAADAVQRGRLRPYPHLRSVGGRPVPLSTNEVQQLVTMTAEDVDFQTAAPPYPPDNYAEVSPYPTVKYHTQPGFDEYTGYGRIDAAAIMRSIKRGRVPPEASFGDTEWFRTYPTHGRIRIRGMTAAVRARRYHWTLEVGRGVQPEPNAWHTVAKGHGRGGIAGRRLGVLARVRAARIAALWPAGTSFTGGPVDAAGQPNPDRFTFTFRLVVVDNHGRVGMDRRTAFLHEDPTLLRHFPRHYRSSIDAPPTFAPLGPHHTDVLLVATTGGRIDALKPSGRELRGWPVRTRHDPVHRHERAFRSHAVTAVPRGAVIGGVAVGDLKHAKGRRDDVVATDFAGHVYAWNAHGRMLGGFPQTIDRAYGGPAARDEHNRVQSAIIGAPALADLHRHGRLDIVVASMDRHVYAWNPHGRPLPGWPVEVIDRSKVSAVNPSTGRVSFTPSSHVSQGSPLVDTPAVGALSGKGRPDVLVGSDEEYADPPNISASSTDAYLLGRVPLLNPGNSRVYALTSAGKVVPGWPAAIADLEMGLLPDVGDGTTASPVLARLGSGRQLDVGESTSVGPAYLLRPDGRSALGTGPDGKARVLSVSAGGSGNSPEVPTIPAVGMPIFAPLGAGAPGVSLVDPAASVGKALDAALPDDNQLHNNEIDAWNTSTGDLQPAFPQAMNDLQFIASPIAADVAGRGSGPFIVAGSGTYDVRAIDATGTEAPGYPKFTGGWLVNAPSFGVWGRRRTQVLAAATREGNLFVWRSSTPACANSGPWPREHHDLANTSNLAARRLPGQRPFCRR